MRVCIFGTGYVGLVTGTCLAEVGHDVVCVDIDQAKVQGLASGYGPSVAYGRQGFGGQAAVFTFACDVAGQVVVWFVRW